MIPQLPFKKSVDLPLGQDSSAGFVPWVLGMMLWVALLAGMIGVGISFYIHQTVSQNRFQVTVALPAIAQEAERSQREKQLYTQLGALEGVAGISPLSQAQIQKIATQINLVIPSDTPAPLPIVVDVVLSQPYTTQTLDRLRTQIDAISADAMVFVHQELLGQFMHWLFFVRQLVWAIVGFFFVAALLVVAFSVRTGVRIHHSILEILHVMGAPERYISKQFQRHARNNILRAFAVTSAFFSLALFLLFWQVDRDWLALFWVPSFLKQLGVFFVVMVGASLLLVSWITHLTVVWSLHRLEAR